MISITFSRYFFHRISDTLTFSGLILYIALDVMIAIICAAISAIIISGSAFVGLVLTILAESLIPDTELYIKAPGLFSITSDFFFSAIASLMLVVKVPECILVNFFINENIFSCMGLAGEDSVKFLKNFSEIENEQEVTVFAIVFLIFYLSTLIPTAINFIVLLLVLFLKVVGRVIERPCLSLHYRLIEAGRSDWVFGLLGLGLLFFSFIVWFSFFSSNLPNT